MLQPRHEKSKTDQIRRVRGLLVKREARFRPQRVSPLRLLPEPDTGQREPEGVVAAQLQTSGSAGNGRGQGRPDAVTALCNKPTYNMGHPGNAGQRWARYIGAALLNLKNY